MAIMNVTKEPCDPHQALQTKQNLVRGSKAAWLMGPWVKLHVIIPPALRYHINHNVHTTTRRQINCCCQGACLMLLLLNQPAVNSKATKPATLSAKQTGYQF